MVLGDTGLYGCALLGGDHSLLPRNDHNTLTTRI